MPEDLRGSIQMTLTYDHAAGILTVRLIEVKLLSAYPKPSYHNWGISPIHDNDAVELPTRRMKGALEVERLSRRELCEGNLKRGGFFTGDPGGCVKEGSGDGHLSP